SGEVKLGAASGGGSGFLLLLGECDRRHRYAFALIEISESSHLRSKVVHTDIKNIAARWRRGLLRLALHNGLVGCRSRIGRPDTACGGVGSGVGPALERRIIHQALAFRKRRGISLLD